MAKILPQIWCRPLILIKREIKTKMTYKITNWKTGATIHEYGETAKDCLENGVESGISFNNAELNCAELNYA